MRIGLDIQSNTGNKTGIGRYASDLLSALRQAAPDDAFLELAPEREKVMRLDRRLGWQQAGLPRMARSHRVDLLHVTGFDAPLWKPCPVVLTVHDLIGMIFPENLPLASRFYWGWWLPRSTRWADRIIADSENTKRDLVRLVKFPPEKIEVIPLGVSIRFHPIEDKAQLEVIRRKYHLPEKFILYLGTLEPRKGLDTLVEAYRQLPAALSAGLVIAGKRGWYVDPVFQQVKDAGLGPRVHFTGYAADEDLPALYNLASVFVYPSRYEGFGLPPLEALACGTPVVCTNISSLPEVMGNAALYVPPDDPHSLAESIATCLEDPELAAGLRCRGFEQASRFTWEATAARTLNVYREML